MSQCNNGAQGNKEHRLNRIHLNNGVREAFLHKTMEKEQKTFTETIKKQGNLCSSCVLAHYEDVMTFYTCIICSLQIYIGCTCTFTSSERQSHVILSATISSNLCA